MAIVKVKNSGHLIRFSVFTPRNGGEEEREVGLNHYTIGHADYTIAYEDENILIGKGESTYAEHEEEFYYIFLKGPKEAVNN